MNAIGFLARISQLTVVLMTLGWIAVVFTAVFLPGGHPPLSAFVGLAVIVACWVLGTAGVLAGIATVVSPSTVRKATALLFLCANAGWLVFSVLVNFI